MVGFSQSVPPSVILSLHAAQHSAPPDTQLAGGALVCSVASCMCACVHLCMCALVFVQCSVCVVELFLWTIEHTNSSLDIQCNVSPITGFVRHTMSVLYA